MYSVRLENDSALRLRTIGSVYESRLKRNVIDCCCFLLVSLQNDKYQWVMIHTTELKTKEKWKETNEHKRNELWIRGIGFGALTCKTTYGLLNRYSIYINREQYDYIPIYGVHRTHSTFAHNYKSRTIFCVS